MKTKPATKGKKRSKAATARSRRSKQEAERAKPQLKEPAAGERKENKVKKSEKRKAKKRARGALIVEREASVDLQEVSGICLRRGRKGEMWLMAIGDKDAWLAWARLSRRQSQELDWEYVDVSTLPGSKLPACDPQIEAICADGTGRVLLLQESPPRAELVDLSDVTAGVVASIELGVGEEFGDLAESWAHPRGSLGEGAVLLRNGHLLVAKEKQPAALIEFGPPHAEPLGLARGGALRNGERWQVTPGDHEYVALAAWMPDRTLSDACEDFSDLEIGPDGCLYLLSDQSKTIARLGDLPPGGGMALSVAVWKLGELGGKSKPEGLAFTPQGHAIIALDKRKAKKNLMLMKPAIAGGK